MKFNEFARYLDDIESVTSRLVITEKLASLFAKLAPSEIEHVSYLLQGRVAAPYIGLEFGLAEKSVIKAAATALQQDLGDLTKRVREMGDLGLAIEAVRAEFLSLQHKNLSVDQVFERFLQIARTTGEGSQEAKSMILGELLSSLDALSCRYVCRIPLGQMRLGASDVTVLDALSWMLSGSKRDRPAIERAYQVRPDIGFIARRVKEEGVAGLLTITPEVGTPILMMRAERLSSGEEIIANLGPCLVEPKYDGFRLQVHVKKASQTSQRANTNDLVKIFTRGLEDMTLVYPDIARAVVKELQAESAIIEGEALGYDPATGKFLPFQETTQRKRKHDVEKKMKEIPLRFMVFDLLFVNGTSLIREPLVARRAKLRSCFEGNSRVISLAPEHEVSDPADIEAFFDEYVSEGLEGIMAKKKDGEYKPGAREYAWVKLKRSYSEKTQDTLDCVVMGYDLGKGKRADFGIGAVLVGVYDKKREKYVTVAKIGTGMTDDEWRALKDRSLNHASTHMPPEYEVLEEMVPDVWVSPSQILEIRCDELTQSKLHTSGWGLRFPRLERFRDDKKPTDATHLEELEKISKR
jgi:DNA ligase-1